MNEPNNKPMREFETRELPPGQTAPGAEAPEAFPLDDAAIESLAELDTQERNIGVARTAILSYFLRQHKLKGNWALAENRRELVKTPAATANVGQ